jgi:hypothetical protein
MGPLERTRPTSVTSLGLVSRSSGLGHLCIAAEMAVVSSGPSTNSSSLIRRRCGSYPGRGPLMGSPSRPRRLAKFEVVRSGRVVTAKLALSAEQVVQIVG